MYKNDLTERNETRPLGSMFKTKSERNVTIDLEKAKAAGLLVALALLLYGSSVYGGLFMKEIMISSFIIVCLFVLKTFEKGK